VSVSYGTLRQDFIGELVVVDLARFGGVESVYEVADFFASDMNTTAFEHTSDVTSVDASMGFQVKRVEGSENIETGEAL